MEYRIERRKINVFSFILAVIAAILFISPVTTAGSAVHAAVKSNSVSSATPQELAVADELERMFVDGNINHLDIDYLIATYGKEEVQKTERFIGISSDESQIFPKKHSIVKRDLTSIGNCMLGKLGDEIKNMVNVNTIVAYIDKKLWLEAAKAIVAKVAAQGIKRNAAVMAGLLAWYAVQCGMGW